MQASQAASLPSPRMPCKIATCPQPWSNAQHTPQVSRIEVKVQEEKEGAGRVELRESGFDLVLPVPHLLEEVCHVDFLRLHLHHPGMLKHAPWCCSSGTFFLETVDF